MVIDRATQRVWTGLSIRLRTGCGQWRGQDVDCTTKRIWTMLQTTHGQRRGCGHGGRDMERGVLVAATMGMDEQLAVLGSGMGSV